MSQSESQNAIAKSCERQKNWRFQKEKEEGSKSLEDGFSFFPFFALQTLLGQSL